MDNGTLTRAAAGLCLLALLALLAGCGGSREDEEPMAVEDTAFGPLIGTQDQVRDRTHAAMDAHREALRSQIEAAEDAPPAEE